MKYWIPVAFIFFVIGSCSCSLLREKMAGKHALQTAVFEPVRGCRCSGTEIAGYGSGPRRFAITCTKRDSHRQCQYQGNPHCCAAYNRGNQQQFYEELARVISLRICRDPNPKRCADTPRGYFARMCGDRYRKSDDSNFYYQG